MSPIGMPEQLEEIDLVTIVGEAPMLPCVVVTPEVHDATHAIICRGCRDLDYICLPHYEAARNNIDSVVLGSRLFGSNMGVQMACCGFLGTDLASVVELVPL